MPDRVDLLVQMMEQAVGETNLDRLIPESQIPQLKEGYNAMLPRRQLRQGAPSLPPAWGCLS